ncbi:hypothetical protein [Streptomyces venezuelae]|uniref:hypothetical protein n=1 Tax=Streptomyces venezuelae TaxID=54571 RepID=UPI003427C721
MDAVIRTIPYSYTKVIGRIRHQLTQVTRHNGAHDLEGVPVSADEAWGHLPPHGRGKLRELDAVHGLYEIRVNGTLRYELRRPLPLRIDVVVDRGPDSATEVRVFVDGAQAQFSAVHTHVVDPGAGGADHAWMQEHTALDDSVPGAVAARVGGLARFYHERSVCAHPDCAAESATDAQGCPAGAPPANREEAPNAAAGRAAGVPVKDVDVRYARARVGGVEFDGREIRTGQSRRVFRYRDHNGAEQTTAAYALLPPTP